ncbi:disulfide bond formation protein B [Sneathiella limimaris]|uniref:disulfide bond formation protein B n=1 Tax=Sneathiella limimaris TaxID=1964213 RepID=UPI00146F41E4|nr:disulfide bond formation protein B [Sneathiella limimaris]
MVQAVLKSSLWIALLVSVLTLGAVFVAQYGFDLQPCVLCVYQRWPYAAVIAICLLAVLLKNQIAQIWFKLLAAIAFATTAGIAAFHVGVEQKWWKGTSSCSADSIPVKSLAELKAQIMAAPITKCDEIAWEMFGISMAGYNFLLAVVMVVFMLLSLRQER